MALHTPQKKQEGERHDSEGVNVVGVADQVGAADAGFFGDASEALGVGGAEDDDDFDGLSHEVFYADTG